MRQQKINKLRKKGWIVGDALDFVNIGITDLQDLVTEEDLQQYKIKYDTK